MEIAALNSTLCYENLPELPLASYAPPPSLSPQPFAKAEFLLQLSKYQSFALIKKTPPSKHTEVFEREIQPHEMLKYLYESVVVL